jgi:hypothetical protein
MALVPTKTPATKPERITLPTSLNKMDKNQLKQHIADTSVTFYGDQPKDLQVEGVASLAGGQHCFVRVGTGYGKTQISEIYYHLFKRKGIVLVLNPLDSLGEDQVRCSSVFLLHGKPVMIATLPALTG